MKLSELKLNENNPRLIKDEKFKKLVKSIKDFPKMMELRPIVVDKEKFILGGNMRYRALQEAGTLEIPDTWVKIANELTDEEKKRFIIEDNMPFGEWDWEMLANQFEVGDLLEWGFSENELKIDQEVIEDEVPEVTEEAVSKLGEVYQLGRHRLMCGDSTKIEDVEKLMDGKKIKTVFTSPPYNMGGGMYKNYSDDLKSDEYIKFNLQVINNIVPFLRGYLFWNISYNKNSRWEFIEIMYKIVKETGLRFLEMIVWDKGHAMPITAEGQLTRQYEDILMVGDGDTVKKELELYFLGTNEKQAYFNKKTNRGITNYWRVNTNKIQNDINKACYPVNLPAKGIRLTSDEGDVVYDPFLGSGTTLVASEQLNRICYGIELDTALCDVIRKRYAKFIGKEEEWQTITPLVK